MYNQNTVTGNNIQGNGFGILVFDTTTSDNLPPAGTNIDATGNYWGSPDGPTVVDFNTVTTPSSDDGDQVQGPNQGVNYTPFSNVPLALQNAPGNEPDAAPVVNITSPNDGATVQPGTATTVTATASDDIGVKSVTFRQGNTVIGTSNGPTYSAIFTPTQAQAGTSQVITATATDSKGQTTTTAISVNVAGPTSTPTAEDQPPTVAIKKPKGKGKVKLKVGKKTTVKANAKDDNGIVSVAFYFGGKQICKDLSAPYKCQFRPRNGDAGRTSLVVIATDTAGQTATAIKAVTVKKGKKGKKGKN